MDLLVCHEGESWELKSLGNPKAVGRCPSREAAVQLACAIAQESGGSVYVYNESGQMSSMYAFGGAGGTAAGTA